MPQLNTQPIIPKFETGHEVFDHIADFRKGSVIVLLDETRFESMFFVNALMANFPNPSSVHVLSLQDIHTPFHVERLDFKSLMSASELGIVLGGVRGKLNNHGVIIHHYLPHLLMAEAEENVLRLVQHWMNQTLTTRLVEIMIVPQGTFPSFENKLLALANGAVRISLKKEGEGKTFSISILRACQPQYHMYDFPFKIRDGKLLIKWGDEFTDKIPREEDAEIKRRKNFLAKNSFAVRLVLGRNLPKTASTYDSWLFTQVIGKGIEEISLHFPERLDYVMTRLASWNIQGIIEFDDVKASDQVQPKAGLNFNTRMSLLLPTFISLLFLKARRARLIPLEVYRALRNSVESYGLGMSLPVEVPEKLQEIERYFQEMAARKTAIRLVTENGEDPRTSFDLKYLPKVLTLALAYGYQLKPKVERIDQKTCRITLKDCFICAKIQSDTPVCELIEGTLTGSCAIMFKESFQCIETECKAKKDPACVFIVRPV